jgi:hypothetical protein
VVDLETSSDYETAFRILVARMTTPQDFVKAMSMLPDAVRDAIFEEAAKLEDYFFRLSPLYDTPYIGPHYVSFCLDYYKAAANRATRNSRRLDVIVPVATKSFFYPYVGQFKLTSEPGYDNL